MRLVPWIACGSLLLALAGACGSPRVPVVTPTATARTAATGTSPVEVELYRMELRFDESGAVTRTVRHRHRIIDPAAIATWGQSEASWSPWRMDRPQVKATVTTAGRTVTLDPAQLVESPVYPEAPDHFSDDRVLRGPLPGVAVGSTIDEVTTIRSRTPFTPEGELFYAIVQGPVPRQRVEIVVDAPESLHVEEVQRDVTLAREETREGGRRVVTFRGGPYAALQQLDPLAPADVAAWPYLALGTGTSWAAVAEAYHGIVESKLAGFDLAAPVRETVQPGDDARTRAEKLVGWVRKHVRYVAVEFGESAIVPRDPSKTIAQGYGDCKDQAVLLVGLLREAGLDAHVALLRAGLGEDVLPQLPALNAFNHAIVHVGGDAPFWIDPAADLTRVGDLPPQDRGRSALVVGSDTEGLVRTPDPDGALNTYEEERTVELVPWGAGSVRETTTATGACEQELRARFLGSADAAGTALRDYAKSTYAAADLRAHELTDPRDLTAPFRITLEATGARTAVTQVTAATVVLDTGALFGWIPSALVQERKLPLDLPIPHRSTIRYAIRIPPGFVAGELPSNRRVVLGPAVYEQTSARRGDGAIEVRFTLAATKRRWTADEVNAFRTSLAKLREEPSVVVQVPHAGEALRLAGQPRESVAAYRRAIDENPKSAMERLRMGIVLSDLGFATEGRALADAATALEPSSATVWFTHGDLLARDDLGRVHRAPLRRAQARTSFEKAIALEPQNLGLQVRLGALLEFDEDGVRYGNRRVVEEALAYFDGIDFSAAEDEETKKWRFNALFLAMHAGRHQEVLDRIARAGGGHPLMPELAAIASLRGGSAAVEESRRRGLTPEAQREVLGNVANVLMAQRNYAAARPVVEAVAESGNAKGWRSEARLARKVAPLEPAATSSTTPEKTWIRAMATATAHPQTFRAQARDYLAARAFDDAGASVVLDQLVGSGKRSRVYPPHVVFDRAAVHESIEVEGSDAHGWRVVATNPYDERHVAFMIREAGGLRILAHGRAPSELGCEALHRLRGGQQDAARRWLAWARPLVGGDVGADPLATNPSARLAPDADPEVSAAVLCAQGRLAQRAVPALQAARKKAAGSTLSAVLHALVLADLAPAEELALAEQLVQLHPGSWTGQVLQLEALSKLKRHDEARRRIVAWGAQAEGRDTDQLLAGLELAAGRYEASYAHYDAMRAKGLTSAYVLNQLAWVSLFVPRGPTDADLQHALRGAEGEAGASVLHTLASVQAELGLVDAARATMDRLLALRPSGDPNADDWYVYGRIAEQLGLSAEARRIYGLVTANERRGSTSELARRRLAALR